MHDTSVQTAARLDNSLLPVSQTETPFAEVHRAVLDNTIFFSFPCKTEPVKRRLADDPPFYLGDKVIFTSEIPISISLELQVSIHTPLVVIEVNDDADTLLCWEEDEHYPVGDKRRYRAVFPNADFLVVLHPVTDRQITAPFHVFRNLSR